MNLEAFVPFVTYPEANADACAMHAVSLAASLNAGLHAVAINADIPNVSNALSTFLLDTPTMIREAEAASRQRGEHLLALVREKAQAAGVDVATAAIAAPLASLAEYAATSVDLHFKMGLEQFLPKEYTPIETRSRGVSIGV